MSPLQTSHRNHRENETRGYCRNLASSNSSNDLQHLNRVRMHQQVLNLLDVMDASGRTSNQDPWTWMRHGLILQQRRRRRRRRRRKRRSNSHPSQANKGGYCGPPNDCNLLASGTHPSNIELDAEKLASGTHSSGTEPYNDKGGSHSPPHPMMVTPCLMTVNAACSPQ